MSAGDRSSMRRAAGLATLLAAALAAGCGTVAVAPPAPAPVVEPAVADVPAPDASLPAVRPSPTRPAIRPPARPGPTARSPRGGGYYMDDGPGDNPPVNIASIPDAVPRAEPLHPVANRPYTVFGRGYVPRLDVTLAHRERGHASWYGRKFHGRNTSSGERYDMYGMTAAHPTLPIPSYVRVTNVRNGRSVVVRVNDRGPFLNRRVIDLTYTAAYKLGYVDTGSAEVELELLSVPGAPQRPIQTAVRADVADGATAAARAAATMPTPMLAEAAAERLSMETTIDDRPIAASGEPVAAAVASMGANAGSAASASASTEVGSMATARDAGAVPAGGPGTWLQLGAFASRDNAEAARAKLQRELPWLLVPVELSQQGELWRLQIGPWARRDDATSIAERIASGSSFRPFPVVR